VPEESIAHLIAPLPTENEVSSNRTKIRKATGDLPAGLRRVCVCDQAALPEIDRVKMKMTYMFFFPPWKARLLLKLLECNFTN
jgi:hypothetical protein